MATWCPGTDLRGATKTTFQSSISCASSLRHSGVSYFPQGDFRAGMGIPEAPELLSGLLSVKDIRVYPRLLSFDEIETLSHDAETCADIADVAVSSAPAACQIRDVQSNCPVSCQQALSPMCYDGTPPLPQPGAAIPVPPKYGGLWIVIAVTNLVVAEPNADISCIILSAGARKSEGLPCRKCHPSAAAGLGQRGLIHWWHKRWGIGLDAQMEAGTSEASSLIGEICMGDLYMWSTLQTLITEAELEDPIAALGFSNSGYASGLLASDKRHCLTVFLTITA
eukprot:scaffold14745_cov51-Prasinocladus_malaysianus.AAC.2